MFRPDYILARLKAQPFRPLRIIASEGLHYDIHHPDLVMVGERDIAIGISRRENPIYDRMIRLAIQHVVGLEDLPVTPTANSPAEDGN